MANQSFCMNEVDFSEVTGGTHSSLPFCIKYRRFYFRTGGRRKAAFLL